MINILPNQPLVFGETQSCNDCFNSDYCTPIEGADITDLEVKLTEISPNFLIDFSPLATGTTTATIALSCKDSGATFLTDRVIVGAIVKNKTNNTYAKVLSVASETELILDLDIFLSDEVYYILNWELIAGVGGTDFTWDDQDFTFTFGGKTEISLDQRLFIGKYYKTRFSSIGNLLGRGNVKAWSGTLTYATMKATIGGGVYDDACAFFVADGIDFKLKFTLEVGSPTVTISSITCYEMSTPAFKVQDCEDQTVFYDSGTTGISLVEAQYDSNIDSWGMISIDWNSIVGDVPLNDCYCICIYDYANLNYEYIFLGRFSGNVYSSATFLLAWNITNVNTAGFALSGESILHTGEVGPAQDTLLQILPIALDATKTYILTADIGYIGAGFDLYVRANPGAVTLATINITADITISVPITGYALTDIYFNSDEQHTWSIDNVSIQLAEVDCEASGCLSLAASQDSISRGCNLLLSGTCDNNAFGFNFDDLAFNLQVRVLGKIRNARYQNETEDYRYDTGESILTYANTRKIVELQIYEVPEVVHDLIRLIILCDTFTVDGVNYIMIEGDYTPNWRKSSVKAPVIIEIAEKTQDTTNTFC